MATLTLALAGLARIERPKKSSAPTIVASTNSGRHKRHTLKAQLVIDLEQGQFLAVATGKGRTHDLR